MLALTNKGYELSLKGHYARATEKYALAAECLLPGPADCIIAASVRVKQANMLIDYATASAARPADANVALRKAYFDLLPAAMDVLQRRKAAGTLLPGTCRPFEVAWFAATCQHCIVLQGLFDSSPVVNEHVACRALYAGVEAFILAASTVGFVLINFDEFKDLCQRSDEMTEWCNKSMPFLLSALELMALPRPEVLEVCLSGEPELVRLMRHMSPYFKKMQRPDVRFRSRCTVRGGVCCAAAFCASVT